MNRISAALLAALEALIVAAIGVGVALAPLTILWATHFDLALDWAVFWRGAVDVWLAGHGVDLTVHLDATTVAQVGLPGAGTPFPVTIALLGFAVLTVTLGVRAGMRAGATGHRPTGVIASIATFGIIALVLTLSAGAAVVHPSVLQGILLPTLVYAVAVLAGSEAAHARDGEQLSDAGPAGATDEEPARAGVRKPVVWPGSGIRAKYRALHIDMRDAIATAVRAGTAASAMVVGVAAIAVTVLVLVNYGTVIGLYESLRADVAGGIALTIGQVAFIPNLVVWAAAWFIGPGVALGTGTSVSPLGATLGPVPGVPIFGILPHGTFALGFLGLLVPVLAGFLCAMVVVQRMPRRSPAPAASLQAVTGIGIGVVAGLVLGLLAWWSGGAIGPGRLADVGPNPLLVGALAFVEVGISGSVGAVAGRHRERA